MAGGGTPAGADVTSLSGAAFGIQTTGLLTLGPVPTVQGGSPPIAFGPLDEALVGIGLPGPQDCPNVPLTNIIQACVIDVLTMGIADADPHLHRVHSQSTVAGATVGSGLAPLLSLSAITASCNADGNGASGAADVVSAALSIPRLANGQIAPNTNVILDNILQVRLNEQIVVNEPGVASIVVNAARITLLGASPFAGLEVTIGHVACAAAGPDVNQVTTTTGGVITTTSTTIDGITTTTGGGIITTTTLGPGVTTTTNPSQSLVTTVPGAGTGAGGAVVAGVLARTGAMLKNGMVWAVLILFLGGLAVLSSRGEVQTWPPKRRPSNRASGPKRTSSTWPRNRSGRRR